MDEEGAGRRERLNVVNQCCHLCLETLDLMGKGVCLNSLAGATLLN